MRVVRAAARVVEILTRLAAALLHQHRVTQVEIATAQAATQFEQQVAAAAQQLLDNLVPVELVETVELA
jgi:hypothetical protein